MKKDNVKKSPKANLELHKATYWLMGLVLAVALVFMALEWTTQTRALDAADIIPDLEIEEELLITRHDPPPPPPPPPPEPEIPEILEVVDYEVEDRIEIEEISETVGVIAQPPPPPAPVVEEVDLDEIFVVVEQAPEFPGGSTAMNQWLSSNIRYPTIAQENNIQGRVMVQFVVERDGSITDVQIVRGVDPSLDREAIRVTSAMPRWTPGMQRGQPVRVRFTLPVTFRLQNVP